MPKSTLFTPEIRSEEQRLNSSHDQISYAVFCLKKKNPWGAMHTTPPGLRANGPDGGATRRRRGGPRTGRIGDAAAQPRRGSWGDYFFLDDAGPAESPPLARGRPLRA